jgi:hypothetical protein
MRLLRVLAEAGQQFRTACIQFSAGALDGPAGDWERGVIVFGQVRETVSGPGGRYTLVKTEPNQTLVAIPEILAFRPSSAGAVGNPKELKDGVWVVVGGVARSAFVRDGSPVVYVLPFGWVPGPEIMPAPPGS